MSNPPGWDAYLSNYRAWLQKRYRRRPITVKELRDLHWWQSRSGQGPYPKPPIDASGNPLPYPSEESALGAWQAWAAAINVGPGGYPLRPPPPSAPDPAAWKAWHEAPIAGPGGYQLNLAPHELSANLGPGGTPLNLPPPQPTYTQTELEVWLVHAAAQGAHDDDPVPGITVSAYDPVVDGPKPPPFRG